MSSDNGSLVGIIPAGGFGKRMRPFKMWKELIPVGYKVHKTGEEIKHIPKVLAEYTLENMVSAGARNIIMVLNEQKNELFRYFGDGNDYNASMAYLCQDSDQPLTGMPVALDTAYLWVKDKTVLMGMPDTIAEPFNSFSQLINTHEEKKADLTLGIFPTNCPQRLAPVMIDKDTGKVKAIFDKPRKTNIYNTWSIAVWSSEFTRLLHEYVEAARSNPGSHKKELLLSDVFVEAINQGLGVYGHVFSEGAYHDLGDINEFVPLRQKIEDYHMADINTQPGAYIKKKISL